MNTRFRPMWGLLLAMTLLAAACSGSAVESGEEEPVAPADDAPADDAAVDDAPEETSEEEDPADAATEPADSAATDSPAPSEPAGGDAEPSGTITVGLINPITGPFAALGEDTNAGFELYVEEQGGQLSGYDVVVESEDTGNDAAIATDGVERLLNADADVLVGFVNSGVAYGASEVIRESGVPLIITTAGADNLTQRDAADNIFRVSYTSSQDAMPLGDYACNELGYENVAVVGLDYAFGWEAAGGFSKAFTDAGCTVVQELYAPLGTQDWAPFVQQIDRDADAVWAVIAGSDAIRFARSYSDFGVGLPLLGHGSLTDEQVLAEQAQTAEGAVTTLHYSGVIDSEDNATFVEAFEAASGRSVSQYAEHGYAAAQVIEAALAEIDEVSSDALNQALLNVQIDAPRGPLSFDEFGQAVYTVYVREVAQDEEGNWVNSVIDEIPDVSQFWTYDPEEFMAEEPLADRRGTWATG
ncbi:ABC transporter substrate-binding protein [soil metagenome]